MKTLFQKFTILLLGFIFIALPVETSYAQTNFEFFLGSGQKYKNAVIKEVYSTDSFKLESGEKIQMIGLRAEKKLRARHKKVERDKHGFVIEEERHVEDIPIEESMYRAVEELLINQRVRIELDYERASKDHKTLAYVFLLDGTFLNAEILRNGYAHLHIHPLNSKYNKELRAAYKEARNEHRGLQN